MFVIWVLLPILTTAVRVVDWRFLSVDEFNGTDKDPSKELSNLYKHDHDASRASVRWNFLHIALDILFERVNLTLSRELKSMGRIPIPDYTYNKICTNGTLHPLPSTTRLGPPYMMIVKDIVTFVAYLDIGDLQFEYLDCGRHPVKGKMTSNRVYWQVSLKRVGTHCKAVVDKFKLWSGNFTWGTSDDLVCRHDYYDMHLLGGLLKYLFGTLVPQYQRIFENHMRPQVAKFTDEIAKSSNVDKMFSMILGPISLVPSKYD